MHNLNTCSTVILLGDNANAQPKTSHGTHEPTCCFVVAQPNPHVHTQGKPLDYEAMGREQRSLAAIIREHAGGRRAEPADRMIMRAQVSTLSAECAQCADHESEACQSLGVTSGLGLEQRACVDVIHWEQGLFGIHIMRSLLV